MLKDISVVRNGGFDWVSVVAKMDDLAIVSKPRKPCSWTAMLCAYAARPALVRLRQNLNVLSLLLQGRPTAVFRTVPLVNIYSVNRQFV
jgi:hypothetical protein